MDIKRILKKSSWKGEEIGKLLIHTLADSFMENLNPKHKPAVKIEDINTMRDSIKSPSEGRIYNDYVALHDMLVEIFSWSEAQNQQVHQGFFRLWSYLQGAISAEYTYESLVNKMPLIMTEQQYTKRLTQKEMEKRAYYVDYANLILSAAGYYNEQIGENPKNVPAKIKAALKKLEKQPVKNQRVLSIYNEVNGIGYYQLPDGRREDQMSKEEWEATLNEEYDKGRVFVKQYGTDKWLCMPLAPEFNEDTDALYEFEQEKIGAIERLARYKGMPEEEIQQELDKKLKELNIIPIGKHISPTPPEVLSLKDILDEGPNELYRFDEDDTEAMAEFLADYEELHSVIREELSKIAPLKEKIDKLKPRQYFKKFATWGELADLGVLNYPEHIQPNDFEIVEDINGNGERKWNGIAVLKQVPRGYIDAGGDFIDPYEEYKPPMFSLESLVEYEDQIIFGRELFLSACEECLSCFALMDTLGDVYDVTETTEILKSKNIGLPEGKIESYNYIAARLYDKVKEQPEKQALVLRLFPPLDVSQVMPTKGAIEKTIERLDKDRGTLRNKYSVNLRGDIIAMSKAERKKNDKD